MVFLDQKAREGALTQEQQAQLLGVSDSLLTMVRAGDRKPGIKLLRAVMAVYADSKGICMEYLMGEIGEEGVVHTK